MQMVYIKKSLLKNENKKSLRKCMRTHQLLDIKEKAKVIQGGNMASGTQRFENYVQVMIYSSRESRPGILRVTYDCRAMYKKYI